MVEKSKIAALTISFIFTGMGLAYLGDIRKGVTILAIAIILHCFGLWIHGIFAYISILLWAYALYLTWRMADEVCG